MTKPRARARTSATALQPLRTRCRGLPRLTRHHVRTETDRDGNVMRVETGWGPDPYAGVPAGWSFSYTSCRAPE